MTSCSKPLLSKKPQRRDQLEREKAILATLGLGFPLGKWTFPEKCFIWREKQTNKTTKISPTHSESQPLDMKLFCFCPVMLSFSFCFAVLESPSDQTASSSTHTLIPFCSVCLPLCSTGIKNYFAEREECQWLCARRIQNLLTGGAHLKDKHPVIVNPRTAFFFLSLCLESVEEISGCSSPDSLLRALLSKHYKYLIASQHYKWAHMRKNPNQKIQKCLV